MQIRPGKDVPVRQFSGGHVFSPNGAWLAFRDSQDGVGFDHVVLDVATSKEVVRVRDAGCAVFAFSGDGKHLAAAIQGGLLRRYRTDTWEATATSPVGDDRWDQSTTCFAVSPDGKLAAFGTRMNGIRIWDFDKKAVVRGLLEGPLVPHAVAFSPDGKRLAAVTGYPLRREEIDPAKGEVVIWDAGKGERTFKGQVAGSLRQVAFSPDGKRLVACGTFGTIAIWEEGKEKLLTIEDPTKRTVHDARFTGDGKHVVTVAWAAEPRLWDASTGQSKGSVKTNWGFASMGVISPDARGLFLRQPDAGRYFTLEIVP